MSQMVAHLKNCWLICKIELQHACLEHELSGILFLKYGF